MFGGCVLVVGMGLTWGLGRTCYLQWRSSSAYVPVQGRVLSVETRQDYGGSRTTHTYFRPVIRYEYVVDGAAHASSRYAYQHGVYGSSAEAEQVAAQYTEGGAVTVYYDPHDPDQSVLYPAPPSYTFTLLFCTTFLLIGCLCVAHGVRGWRRRKAFGTADGFVFTNVSPF